MSDDYYMDEVYALFWICLWYFLGFVLVACGYFYNSQTWIYYGLFFIILGMLYNISSSLMRIERMLDGAEISFELIDDEMD